MNTKSLSLLWDFYIDIIGSSNKKNWHVIHSYFIAVGRQKQGNGCDFNTSLGNSEFWARLDYSLSTSLKEPPLPPSLASPPPPTHSFRDDFLPLGNNIWYQSVICFVILVIN